MQRGLRRLFRPFISVDYREAHALHKNLSEESLKIIRQRLPGYLTHRSWEVRNLAIKLICDLADPAFYPILVQKVRSGTDKGIITRNAVQMMRELRLNDAEAEYAIRRALSAPYWEVRSEALFAMAALFEPTPERIAAVINVLAPRQNAHGLAFGERNFEVRAAAAVALGRLGDGTSALPVLQTLAEDSHWVVRHQAAVALVELNRRLEHVGPSVLATLKSMQILSDGCRSDFPFPRAVRVLRRIASNGLAHTDVADIRCHYIDLKSGWNRSTTNRRTPERQSST